jgi:drug/metabolite transporter (DMT)-like permease
MRLRGYPVGIPRNAWLGGTLSGLFFAAEFFFLFIALDIGTVSRVSVIFYSMPVWLTLIAHFLLPGERLSGRKIAGLALAMGGVALALLDREAAAANWTSDLFALASAFCWAGIALCVRITPLSEVPPAQQLMFQVAISAPILLFAALFTGPLIRELAPIHVAGLLFQIVAVASLGFLVWILADEDLPGLLGRLLQLPLAGLLGDPRLAASVGGGGPLGLDRAGAGGGGHLAHQQAPAPALRGLRCRRRWRARSPARSAGGAARGPSPRRGGPGPG